MNDIYGRAGGYLSTRDCAEALNVDISTVWKFIKEGILPATNVGNGNYRPIYGISLDDLNQFKKTYIWYAERKPDSKRHIGRKKKKPVEPVEVDKVDETEIEELKKEMSLIAEKLLEISCRLEELSKK